MARQVQKLGDMECMIARHELEASLEDLIKKNMNVCDQNGDNENSLIKTFLEHILRDGAYIW